MARIKQGVSTFIGEQLSGVPYPVFFDTHFPIINNKPPGILVTGSPGSGKTWLLLLLCSHASLMGKTNVILDPKGDFIALKKLEREGILENIKVWNLAPQVDNKESMVADENNGVLDPMTFFDNPDENVALAKSVITSLVGGTLTDVQSNYLVPVLKDVVASQNPSFNEVVSRLSRNQKEEIRTLGIQLNALSGLGLAKLLFTDRRKQKAQKVELIGGTTVINLMGLSLPVPGSNQKTWTENEKLSMTIMALITNFVTSAMLKDISKEIFKMVTIDEAWSVMASQTGRDLINKVGLLGRSLNVALLLATQSPNHIEKVDGVDISNTISVRFAFKNDSKNDNLTTVNSMNLPSGEGWEEIGLNLDTGQCLLHDSRKNTGVIQVSVPYEWQSMFDTNPLALIEN
jgi:hypothetical protein